MENYISELRGYLQSLRRLSRRQCDFHVDSFLIKNEINKSIEEYINRLGAEFKFVGIKPLTYLEVENLLKKHLILELETESQSVIELFLWDIVEYYGLASTSLSLEGKFNPLVSDGALEVEVHSPYYSSGAVFVVVIDNMAVITWLNVRE